MSVTSSRLNLPYLAPAQAQKTVTHNEALQMLDALTQLTFINVGATVPPVAPAMGDTYALGAGANGDWTGNPAGTVATRVENAWIYHTSLEGWRGWDFRTAAGHRWLEPAICWGLIRRPMRSTVGSAASLFIHEGGGHQLKINKASTSDDAGFVLQNDYTTHGLMGLFGTNDLTAKVSPDGTTFHTAFEASAATGEVNFPQGLRVNGGDVLGQYNPGSWTPTFGASSTNPTDAAYTSNGSYVRIGRLVMANFELVVSDRGVGGRVTSRSRTCPLSHTVTSTALTCGIKAFHFPDLVLR